MIMKLLCMFLIITVFSLVVTGVKRRYSIMHKLLDIPNERSSHEIPTPNGGGVGIVVTFLGIVAWLYIDGSLSFSLFAAFLVGGFLVAGVGMIDDRQHVPVYCRLIVHFFAVCLAIYWLGSSPEAFWESRMVPFGWFGSLMSVIGLVWLLNLFNFMDGIDGVAGIEAICTLSSAAGIFFLINGKSIELFLFGGLVAGCGGFLFWNWPPAKIFMGDVGSGFLGYIIGVFVLETAASETLTPWVWVILLGVFIVDSSVTLLIRLLNFEKVYQAHCSHAYQRAARKYQSHKKITIAILLINQLWLFPLALGAALRPEWGVIITLIAFVPLVLLTIKLGAGKRI